MIAESSKDGFVADFIVPPDAGGSIHSQLQELRSRLWQDLPTALPERVSTFLCHQLRDSLLRHGLVSTVHDDRAQDHVTSCIFRIVHAFSRDPWIQQEQLLIREGLDRSQLIRLNAAIRESDLLQKLMVREGPARQYWNTILPLVQSGSIDAVLKNEYRFPLRIGIYPALSCMFACSFCGRMENPDARYMPTDVAAGHDLFEQVFASMPRGASTLSLAGGLEPLTNPGIDRLIHAAKAFGHKRPLLTNGYLLTPVFVTRHQALWDLDVLRISLYGVDEESYFAVTKKRAAFQLVKNNVIELLKARQQRQSGPRIGFNFIVLFEKTGEVLKLLDLIEEINAASGGRGVDFLTLREDFSAREGDGLSMPERHRLVSIFREFDERRKRSCPELEVDFGYALYPLSQGTPWSGLAMVDSGRMLPKAYPQVSVAIDLLGDVYLYRDAAFPGRPNAHRYRIGTIGKSCSLEAVIRDFVENGQPIVPGPNDPWLMDAFDHVVTNVIWQAKADSKAGIPFELGPIRQRAYQRNEPAGGSSEPPAVNYWQRLYGA